MALVSPDDIPITIRPIQIDEIDRIPLRCWPMDRGALLRLFESQGTLGMAAWEEDRCVAQLHCYRIVLPDQDNPDWPSWNHWWRPDWWRRMTGSVNLELSGPTWCHACCHVGRTLESFRQEIEVNASPAAPDIRKGADPRYFGRGIGTALCRASMRWAWDHNYTTVLALGAPSGLFEFAVAAGHLPWTTYTRLGFEPFGMISDAAHLPQWARGHGPEEVKDAIQAAMAAGRPLQDFYERLMVMNLTSE
jgi:GNAT superfamily N-acetyltransferase